MYNVGKPFGDFATKLQNDLWCLIAMVFLLCIPVQFCLLDSSSNPLGHTQTKVPVELSHVYSQLKPAAAHRSVTKGNEQLKLVKCLQKSNM